MEEQCSFRGIRLPGRPSDSLWDINCRGGQIESIKEHIWSRGSLSDGRLVIPGLCHPHIHLDKCFLLSHPKYKDLEIQLGDLLRP
jgi:cytosine/adenosine deaminase-related metal-dependent hydrolase